MNPDEYDDIAKSLTDELNQKGTLIEFRVLSSLEYSLQYAGFHRDELLKTFAAEWVFKLKKAHLTGSCRLTENFIKDCRSSIADFIINDTVGHITHAILHPDEIPELKITIT